MAEMADDRFSEIADDRLSEIVSDQFVDKELSQRYNKEYFLSQGKWDVLFKEIKGNKPRQSKQLRQTQQAEAKQVTAVNPTSRGKVNKL